MSNTPLFIAIHKHEHGTDVKVFASEDDVEEIFSNLEDESFDDEVLDKVTFANRLNIDFEPGKDETLEISYINHEKFDTIDFSDFK
jgi:hypothetical protein